MRPDGPRLIDTSPSMPRSSRRSFMRSTPDCERRVRGPARDRVQGRRRRDVGASRRVVPPSGQSCCDGLTPGPDSSCRCPLRRAGRICGVGPRGHLGAIPKEPSPSVSGLFGSAPFGFSLLSPSPSPSVSGSVGSVPVMLTSSPSVRKSSSESLSIGSVPRLRGPRRRRSRDRPRSTGLSGSVPSPSSSASLSPSSSGRAGSSGRASRSWTTPPVVSPGGDRGGARPSAARTQPLGGMSVGHHDGGEVARADS